MRLQLKSEDVLWLKYDLQWFGSENKVLTEETDLFKPTLTENSMDAGSGCSECGALGW